MKKFFHKLLGSFDTNSPDSLSARKLSAFVGVMTAIYVTAKEIPQEAQINALYAWLCFALVCLGIVTVEQIIRFKNGPESNTEENPPA
jgi:hypothetical protein